MLFVRRCGDEGEKYDFLTIAQTADGAGKWFPLNNPLGCDFILFLALIAKLAWQFITSSLDKKIDEIRTKIEEATKLREEAQDILQPINANYRMPKTRPMILSIRPAKRLRSQNKIDAGLKNAQNGGETATYSGGSDAQEKCGCFLTDIALYYALQSSGGYCPMMADALDCNYYMKKGQKTNLVLNASMLQTI